MQWLVYLEDNQKKKCSTSAQQHAADANICMMNEDARKATNITTILGEATYKLPSGHPKKQTIMQIVDDINKWCGIALSH